MLSRLILHLVVVIVLRQLLDFEATGSWFAYLLSLLGATLMIIWKCNFGVTYVWTDLVLWLGLALWVCIHGAYVLWIITASSLPLTGTYQSTALSLSFLPCTGSPACHALCCSWLCSTLLRLRIEVLACPWKCGQNILSIFKRFVDLWEFLISSLPLKMMAYAVMSLSCRRLPPQVVNMLWLVIGVSLLMLFYVRAQSTCTSAVIFLFLG